MITVFQLKAAKDRVIAERDEKLREVGTAKPGSIAKRQRIRNEAKRKLAALDREFGH